MDSLDKLEEMIVSFPLHFGKDLQQKLLLTVKQAKIEKEEYESKSITWNVLDFESRAIQREKDNWENVYDKTKFQEYLEKMISKHDVNYGITWNTIDYFLDEYCKKSLDEFYKK